MYLFDVRLHVGRLQTGILCTASELDLNIDPGVNRREEDAGTPPPVAPLYLRRTEATVRACCVLDTKPNVEAPVAVTVPAVVRYVGRFAFSAGLKSNHQ